jgi:hypothetical protein
MPTGTASGLDSFVKHRSLLKKLKAEVLHSTESMWKYLNNLNVKAVEGFKVLAGNKRFLSS